MLILQSNNPSQERFTTERMKIKLVLIDTCGTAEVTPCKYFIDTDTTSHIDSWRYSPLMCRKTVETEFEHIVSPIAELS